MWTAVTSNHVMDVNLPSAHPDNPSITAVLSPAAVAAKRKWSAMNPILKINTYILRRYSNFCINLYLNSNKYIQTYLSVAPTGGRIIVRNELKRAVLDIIIIRISKPSQLSDELWSPPWRSWGLWGRRRWRTSRGGQATLNSLLIAPAGKNTYYFLELTLTLSPLAMCLSM